MKYSVAFALVQALAVQGARIVQGNDDGWAEMNVRVFNDALIKAGHDVVLACPAENKSGTSSRDSEPTSRKAACQYNSCPANSGPVGSDPKRPDLNWVNSYPVTGMRYGIDTFGPQLWGGAAPDLAVAGPNTVSNLWLATTLSGTVGAAAYAAGKGIPAIAFSGGSDSPKSFETRPVAQESIVYAELATRLTNKILKSGKPYLPEGVWLNVNFPKVEGECTDPDNFQWVFTRINVGLFSPRDVNWCGTTRLPHESEVISEDGCVITISPGDAKDKTTVNDVKKQQAVLDKIKDMLVCAP